MINSGVEVGSCFFLAEGTVLKVQRNQSSMLLLLVVVLSSYLPLRGLSSKSWAEYGTREGGGDGFSALLFHFFL